MCPNVTEQRLSWLWKDVQAAGRTKQYLGGAGKNSDFPHHAIRLMWTTIEEHFSTVHPFWQLLGFVLMTVVARVLRDFDAAIHLLRILCVSVYIIPRHPFCRAIHFPQDTPHGSIS